MATDLVLPDDAFRSLEHTRELAIAAAHRTIVELARLPRLNIAGSKQLQILTALVNDAERLEIHRFVTMRRLGSAPAPAPQPDMAKAAAIAAGDPPEGPK